MNQKKNLIWTAFVIMLIVTVMVPTTIYMSMNVPENHSKMILESLKYQQDHGKHQHLVKVETFTDIEAIWELEDAREESEELLVQTMYCGDYELGFDSQSRTFFCTLGMDNEEWPEITLYADGAENLCVTWVDDYAYDSRYDAVREGYSYELFAYTEEAYSYFNLVFTGLPIVTLHVENDDKIGEEYIPARATVFGWGFDAVDSAALVHTRGGGYYKPIEKDAYRLEFHHYMGNGTDKKNRIDVLGMEADSDWLLLSNAQDPTAVRNYLAFDMWNRWNPSGGLMTLESRMVELFVDNEYVGLYQIIQRVSPQKEIIRAGGNIYTDAVARLIATKNKSDKPVYRHERSNLIFEYCYEPQGNADRLFDLLENYTLLNLPKEKQPDDLLFSQVAEQCLNADEILSYFMFLQACLLVHDNVRNNLYIYLMEKDGQITYRLGPWDMDRALYVAGFDEEGKIRQHFDDSFVMARRMLDLGLMDSREKIWEIWKEKRETVISDQMLYDWIMDVEEEINASGAYLRESKKWYGEAQELNLGELIYFEMEQMTTIETNLNQRWPIEK